MSEPTATVAALSNALVAHSNANLPPDLSITFDLRRLPAELREKVLQQAARAGSQEERRHLLAVSSEFYQATARFAWQVVDIEGVPAIERLECLTETILPRCGGFVKHLSLSDKEYYYETSRAHRALAHALIEMPNVRSLQMGRWPSAYEVVSLSPHLASLTELRVEEEYLDSDAIQHLARIVSRAPNLVDLSLWLTDCWGDMEPLVAAVASLRALTTLSMIGVDAINAMVEAHLQGPLTSIDLDPSGTAMTLPTFGTFVSQFSTTLQHLSIHYTPSSWADDPTRTLLPLPHLVHLGWRYPLNATPYPSPLQLFADSPIQRACLNWDTLEVDPNDCIATICSMAMRFMEAHKKTLKHLALSLPLATTTAETEARDELSARARVLGVTLRFVYATDSNQSLLNLFDNGDNGEDEGHETKEEDE